MTCSPLHRWLAAAIAAIAFSNPIDLQSQEVDDAVIKAEQERIAAIAKAKQAAVSVFANGGRGGGSGVVVTPDGYALTNFHVSKPAGNFMKCSMPDGVLYDAVIVGIDPTGDVALIKLLGRNDFPHAELADSDAVRVGDWCFAVGNPFLLATDFQPTVTYGIVSGVHRYQYPAGSLLEYADCIQTDASINPGNSGGPLFNAQGQLIGINGRGSFEKRGRVNVGVGYAISINQIKHFMGYLRSGRIVDHATLGATVTTDEEDGRVVVSNILETSDAFRRGLRYGDEIVFFGRRPIGTVNAFKNVLGIYPKGWRVPLSYRRDGKVVDMHVRLAGVHAGDELISQVQRPKQPAPPQPPKKGDDVPKDDEAPKEQPRIPIQLPQTPGKPAVPEEIAKFYKERSGFANYYFNELNRDRVWNALTGNGGFEDVAGAWLLDGVLANGDRVAIALDEKLAAMSAPGNQTAVNVDNLILGDQLQPDGSGGLLVALHLWQRMLTAGPIKYGDVYYLGTAPLVEHEDLVDVLFSTYKDVEARFMFDPQSGRLLAMEMYPDLDVDACEVRFADYRDVGGRALPHRLEVRFGDQVYAVIQLDRLELANALEKDA